MIACKSELIGSYGQICSDGSDPSPTGCSHLDEIKLSSNGKIECGENYGCCLCKSMICGSDHDDDDDKCDELNCNGDHGCYGVQDIQIYGSYDNGVVLSCNGDISCSKTKIIGKNIKEIICSGDESCSNTIFKFNCLSESPCSISCGGDNSCSGLSINQLTIWNIDNTNGIQCSSQGSCKYGKYTLLSNIGGGSIMCTGNEACLSSKIIITNIQSIICGGIDSCKDASFLIIDPQNDFNIECSSSNSCTNLKIEIIVNNNNDISFFKDIICGSGSCINIDISIINNGDKYITIENLECQAPESCLNAKFDFDGGVGFANCKCGETSINSCHNISGIDSCIAGLNQVQCTKSDSCSNLQQKVVNIANDFELFCNADRSCKGFWFMIILNNNLKENVEYLKGYNCQGIDACNNAIIQLNNLQNNNIIVKIGKIICKGNRSCQGTTFIIVGHVIIDQIQCHQTDHDGSNNSCQNCLVQNTFTNTLISCDSYNTF